MGITVREMLDYEFFKDYKVIAGHRGLDNQVQGLTVIDAPDGFKWTKGREFVISSGYIFKDNLEYFEDFIKSNVIRRNAAFGIKVGRYLQTIPPEIIKMFDENNMPLIDIPAKHAWLEIYNALNVMVMNKNISKFNIGKINNVNYSDLTYQSRKINIILNAIENEMKFPAMLYDLVNEKAYYSSTKFKEMSNNLKSEDFWNPSFNFSKEILCDNLKMVRYRFFEDRYEKPYSWITIPINVEDKTRAYFVVMEATGLIDYFDQFAIRIGFVQLQAMYEQILVAQSVGDKGFSSFINNILSGKLSERDSISNKASELNIDINNKYYMVLMQQNNHDITLSGHKDILINNFRKSFKYNECRMSFFEDNKCVFLYKIDENQLQNQEIDSIIKKTSNFSKRIELDMEKAELWFGLSDIAGDIYEVKRNFNRCLKAIKIGPHLYRNSNILTYSQLGAFAWMDIKEDEFDMMKRDIKVLYESDESKELIETLKAYIEHKMNFSLTAEKLFLHINTVRKRIEKISDLIDVDLNDATSRIKIELLLKLI